MAAPELPVTKAVRALLARDLTLAIRHRGEMANPLIFFVMVATLVPLGVTPEARELARLAPGTTCEMALLSPLLSAATLSLYGRRDGTLEQLVLSPQALRLL